MLDLGLVDRDDPITEMVATAIVGITSMGERDPTTIKYRALNALGAADLVLTPHRLPHGCANNDSNR